MKAYGKYLYIALFVAIVPLRFSTLRAQAPFSGGTAEGHASVRLQVSPCTAIDVNPFSGGAGGGFSRKAEIQQTCVPEAISIFLGGMGGGFSRKADIQQACVPEALNIFFGGTGGGFSRKAEIGDPPCYSVRINPYSGGLAGGFSSRTVIEEVCYSVRINPFQGGTGAGFSRNTDHNADCVPILINIFGGGTAGGFSREALVLANCSPETFSIFAGGDAGGHSYAGILNTIQFPDNGPVFTEVCENGDAVIALVAPGPGLVYQWELSTNGGNSFVPLTDGPDYTGTDTEALTIHVVTASHTGYVYRVNVAYPGCVSAVSPTSTLDVGEQPESGTATRSPDMDIICQGNPVSASFTAGSGGIGDVEDVYEYSVNYGNDWTAYIPSANILTVGLQGIAIAKVRTYRTASGQGCIDSAPQQVEWTVAGEGYWVGVTSADWNTQSNWGCGVVPDITTDVTIPQVQIGNNQPNILISPNAYSRNLTIEPNASVTTFFGNTLEVHGDFINNGISSLGIGKVIFAGSNKQVMGGSSVSAIAYLQVNNSSVGVSLELAQDIAVTDQLQLTDGIVDLNGHDIDLGNTGSLVGESETSRITGYPGEIKSTVNLSSVSTSYNNIAGLGVSITTGPSLAPGQTVVNRGHFTYSLETDKHGIERYFRIEPTVNSNLEASLRIHYLNAELISAAHTKDDLIPWRSEDDGVTWQGQFLPTAQLSNNTAANWVQQDGINAFSIWTLSDWIQEPLPVEWLHFNALPGDGVVNLDWATASEINSHYFTVERSPDAVHFTDILMQPAAGNSSTVRNYTDIDPQPLQGHSYYRLRQTDYDGAVKHSQMVPVFFDRDQPFMNAFVDGNKNFQIRFRALQGEVVAVRLFDVAGRIIYNGQVSVSKGENAFEVYNPGLAKGIYVLELTGSESKISRSQKLLVK